MRLSGRKAFGRVFAAKASASNRLLVIYAASNDLAFSRFGLSVSRKCGPAVTRNRIKRLLREAIRLEMQSIPPGSDYVCIPRAAVTAGLDEYRRAIVSVARRAESAAKRTN